MAKFMLMFSRLLASSTRLKATAGKVKEILNTIVGPTLTALSGCAVVYLVVMGVQYAKAENDGKREEIKKRLVNLAIGIVVMMVLIILCYAIKWDEFIPSIFGGYYGAESD